MHQISLNVATSLPSLFPIAVRQHFLCQGYSTLAIHTRLRYLNNSGAFGDNFWLCTRNSGYQKVILRGFQVLCYSNDKRATN